ncbi:Double-stranded RNA-specific adenosine deaminase [Wickerhamomyces ciferrii]|uniref:Double-stranded RNA-specific adenosine deaminase n=1 Tax=Wickerhamomyces ciferrii (strain ATCC 14091 / BCRC 22168 / CBS 111 / JCM 3599 / NBRC 0793 / NRRL Y-1031 F-60-10) TaxID=1206466 RepID=K0KGQ6_WICCF|nr:Double-stranded RNA-specific adenosine deaminase [Wickerhamomyces ciferrii]CCH44345.1 Double-stranded RNA-specific adenosine deaminase [Wickerhamomyces ciferrii]
MAENYEPIADEIASVVIGAFETKKLKGKPTTRSNGVKEWTVLAGIVAIFNSNPDQYDIGLVSLATGVKAIPEMIISKYSQGGRILHDCHAEVLCIRSFNWVIANECTKVKNGEESKYIEYTDDDTLRFKLKDGIEFALYVSELPCGDSSLEQLIEEDDVKWDKLTKLPGGVLRGREDFMTKGKVRTKPGRRDSPLCMSMSCSDKISMTQFTSLLNGVVSSYCDTIGFFIDLIVVPKNKFDETGMNRAFRNRFDSNYANNAHMIQCLSTNVEEYLFAKDDAKKSPSNTSLIYIPDYDLNESIVNGVKEGFFNKKTYIRKNGESIVSRVKLFEASRPHLKIIDGNYYGLKKQNIKYNELKQIGIEALCGWANTTEDDFSLDSI